MSVKAHYDPQSSILIFSVEGELTQKMLRDAGEITITSDQYPPDVNTIWDFTHMNYDNIDKAFMEEAMTIRKEFISMRKKANIAYVTGTDFEFGMMRMYEMMSVEIKQGVPIFRTVEEAKAWLTSNS